MNVLFRVILCCLTLFAVSCIGLNSVTQIERNKSFVLGENKHLPYTANITNIDSSPVEVLLTQNDQTTSLGILKPNQSGYYKVMLNGKVAFKNLGNTTAKIKIKIVGDTNLSMGYQ